MSNYYDRRDAKVNLYYALVKNGWKCYGFNEDQSDMMTDYWHPASWDGVAEKDGYVLLVDVHFISDSGREVIRYNSNMPINHNKADKLQALIDDKGATEGEKVAAQTQLNKLKDKKEQSKEVIFTYPEYKHTNPKSCTWHIEKDGIIIDKGKGLDSCYVSNNHIQENKAKQDKAIQKLINRFNKAVTGSEALVKQTVKKVKKVLKAVEIDNVDINTISDDQKGKLNIIVKCRLTNGAYNGCVYQFNRIYTFRDQKRFVFYKYNKKLNKVLSGQSRINTLTLSDSTLGKLIKDDGIAFCEVKEVEEVTEEIVYRKVSKPVDNKQIKLHGEVKEQSNQTSEKADINKLNKANINTHEPQKEHTETKMDTNTANNNDSLTVEMKLNEEKNGIELYFSDKPGEEIRDQLKINKFRWSRYSKCWYAKQSGERIDFAKNLVNSLNISDNSKDNEMQTDNSQPQKDIIIAALNDRSTITDQHKEYIIRMLNHWEVNNLANVRRVFYTKENVILIEVEMKKRQNEIRTLWIDENGGRCLSKGFPTDRENEFILIYDVENAITETKSQPTNKINVTYPEINIDDVESYTIDKQLQKRENEAHWVFRTKERDHTKELRETFKYYTEQVKEVIQITENKRIIYYLKNDLQRFKKKYYDAYVKWLSAAGNTPSWVVTGRGGLNASKYNKKMDRVNNLMMELPTLTDDMKKKINKAKYRIKQDELNKVKKAVSKTDLDTQFKTDRRTFTYMGVKENNKRVYVAEGYWICKLWGTFRIFDNKGHEVYSMKTTEKLDDAKRYVCYLINQDKQKIQEQAI